MTRRSSSSSGTGSDPGPRALAADVEDVGALVRQPQRVRDGGLRHPEAAAVGEAVGRDVDDAHDARLVERQAGEPGTRLGERLHEVAMRPVLSRPQSR